MSTHVVVVRGVVKSDGTLELEDKVPLPAGKVQVTVAAENWWQYLQRCRAELETAGATFRRGVDIEADVEAVRGETERVDGIRWEQEWDKYHGEKPSC